MPDEQNHSKPNQFLAFHKLAENYPFESTAYSVNKFKKLLTVLFDNDFKLFNSEEADLLSKRAEVVITFDDGYQHLAKYLPPLIKRFNFRPIIFMPTYWIVKSNHWDFSHYIRPVRHLSASQINSLSDSGVIFGSHSHSHTDLRALPERQLKAELSRSQEILSDLTGQPISTISYPFGRCNQWVQAAIKDAGFKQAFTMNFPEPNDTLLTTGRFPIYTWDGPKAVLRKLNRSPFYKFEKFKAKLVNKASAGTIFLNRIRSQNIKSSISL